VTLVVRGQTLSVAMSAYLVGAIDAEPTIVVLTDAEVSAGSGEGRLERVVVRDRTSGGERTVAADGLFVMIGAEPRTGWLPDTVERDRFGFVLTGADLLGWQGDRRPFAYETSLPGLFAVGDVRAAAVKRVASAVGEGSVVVSQLHQFLAAPGHG
jgi:thioredoxin reductase (NADPH)